MVLNKIAKCPEIKLEGKIVFRDGEIIYVEDFITKLVYPISMRWCVIGGWTK